MNTRRGDGAILTSTDEGNTWTRTEYYHHPGIDVDYGENLAYMYPRWTSALKDNNGVFHIAYEFGGGTGDATSTSYYPGIGGVAYWSSIMPYRGTGVAYGFDPNNPNPPVQGQPFIMDSAYIYPDIYASLWRWSDANHEMWTEYIGYLTPLDDLGNWEDPYEATEYNIEDMTLHGSYNGGVCEMPVLLMTPNQDMMVALWISLDENNTDEIGNYYFKMFVSCSKDNGSTWSDMIHITNDFMLTYTEFVYPQAALTNNKLVITAQVDGCSDTNLLGDDPMADDNYFMGLIFDLNDLFGYDGIDEPVVNNTTLSVYPNPATESMTLNLNQEETVIISNMLGQTVSTFKGNAGINTVDVSNLSSGIYFISAGTATQKFVVK